MHSLPNMMLTKPSYVSSQNTTEEVEAETKTNTHKEITSPVARVSIRRPTRNIAKYKKAPDAPRRFKPPFIFFSAIGRSFGTRQSANISKLVSQVWKSLRPEEKAKWEAMSRDDKARYELEKSLYIGPWRVLKQRKAKDANSPKRPMSAFLAFANSRRAAVKREMPNINNGDLSRALAAMWREAPESMRRAYIEEERDKMQKYRVAMMEWKELEGNGDVFQHQDASIAIDEEPIGTVVDDNLVALLHDKKDDDGVLPPMEKLPSSFETFSSCNACGRDASRPSTIPLFDVQPALGALEPRHFLASVEKHQPYVLSLGGSGSADGGLAMEAQLLTIEDPLPGLHLQEEPKESYLIHPRAHMHGDMGMHKPTYCYPSSTPCSLYAFMSKVPSQQHLGDAYLNGRMTNSEILPEWESHVPNPDHLLHSMCLSAATRLAANNMNHFPSSSHGFVPAVFPGLDNFNVDPADFLANGEQHSFFSREAVNFYSLNAAWNDQRPPATPGSASRTSSINPMDDQQNTQNNCCDFEFENQCSSEVAL